MVGCAGLLHRSVRKGSEGSNPLPSALRWTHSRKPGTCSAAAVRWERVVQE